MQRLLIQLDTDGLPSVFDRVVAVDAGAEQVFSYGGVTPENVVPLVHGAIFTRSPDALKHTAIFVGGSDVSAGERLFEAVRRNFFGPMRVSVMMDSNGSNTTAAAAVRLAGRHLDLSQTTALILGGTGPVGFRAAQLLSRQGAAVRLGSRRLERAREACSDLAERVEAARLAPAATGSAAELTAACEGAELIIAAGAAGVELLPAEIRRGLDSLRVAIDLNAVPPAGLEGVEATDKAAERNGTICYGAIGVGGGKMKIHLAAVARLFDANTHLLDTDAIYEIGCSIL